MSPFFPFLNMQYANPTIQTLILPPLQWYYFFGIWSVDSLLPSFFFQLLPLFFKITLAFYNFFLPIIPNWNVPTSLCSAKDRSSWYHTYVSLFCERLCTLLGLTGNMFPSVPSWLFFLVSGQKRHYIVGSLFQSSYCMMYHWQRYTPYFLISNGSKWYIFACTYYHLDCVDPSSMCLIKNS